MPVLEGEGLDGRPVSTADAAGKVLVVNVWATWCAPCEAEQPALVRVADRYADRGVAFFGVNQQDQVAAANAWVRRFDVPYPSLYDPAGRTSGKLGYVGLPDTYIVDRGGTIRAAVNGGLTESQLSELLDEVLASSPTSGAA
jgi:thiol-disulfide isomerase/thioredoxin